MDFAEWTTLKIAPNPRWLAVKDCRLPVDICPARDMQGIHDWVLQHVTYQRDDGDKWSKPGDTLARGHGDCEDFCILERALLLNAGYRDVDMEMMVVRDLAYMQVHAILWVQQHYVDNRSAKVLHLSQFTDYWPMQGHKGDGSYVYGRKRGLP